MNQRNHAEESDLRQVLAQDIEHDPIHHRGRTQGGQCYCPARDQLREGRRVAERQADLRRGEEGFLHNEGGREFGDRDKEKNVEEDPKRLGRNQTLGRQDTHRSQEIHHAEDHGRRHDVDGQRQLQKTIGEVADIMMVKISRV